MSIKDILDKIKNIFKKQEIKQLPEEKINQIDNRANMMENLKFEPQINKEEPKKFELDSIEFAIDQFISGFEYNRQNNLNTSAYNILTELCSLKNQEAGKNLQNENTLINKLKNKKQMYSIIEQKDKSDKNIAFYHIQSASFNANPEDLVRFYIYTDRKNIAKLSELLVDKFGNETFYFKFLPDNQFESGTRRTESIVIYENKNLLNLNRTLKIIDQIKQENPQLFENSKDFGNPFLKKTADTVALVAEVTKDYIDYNGSKRILSKSFNSYLSTALAESYIQTMYVMVKEDKNLQNEVGEQFMQNIDLALFNLYLPDENNNYSTKANSIMKFFSQAYPYMTENQKYEFVLKMRNTLFRMKDLNPQLDIKTNRSYENER